MGSGLVVAMVESQRPHLALWTPVLFAVGVGLYFLAPSEPLDWMLIALGACVAMCVASMVRAGPVARILLCLLVIPGAGFMAGALRAKSVAAPVLPYEMTANIEGAVAGLDRSGSGRRRVTLDDVVIFGLEPDRTPRRVRISVDDNTPDEVLMPGQRVTGRVRISPPAAPSEPGGFDFRRMAWFQGLGAVGYSRTPLIEATGPESRGWRKAVFSLRLSMARTIQAAIPGRNGGFASAILTGDRSEVDPEAMAALRASNLAHLLAISGLHMGLLTGFVFALVRYGLALIPGVALRCPTKKVAATVALAAGAGYLVLSGANVATQRAFIMTAVVLVAVLIDRPAFTLRSVALAAMIVMLMRPESLTEAGFQMSFAATTALIATFEWLRGQAWWRETLTEKWRFVRPVIGVAMTSFVAGAATAPISAFHFNVMSQYGLAANILAVPAMGLVVMPAAVIAGILGPFGLAWPALRAMDSGIGYILSVAQYVSGLEGAIRPIPAGPMAGLVLIVLGGLFMILWIGRGRALGVLPILAGLAFWSTADRPEILISENGRLFGVRTEAGRAVSSDSGNSFAAESWLQNDGDDAGQEAAFERVSMTRRRGYAEMRIAGLGPIIYRGSKAPDAASASDCATARILLAPRWREAPSGPCLFVGSDLLRREGAIAISRVEGRLEIDGARSRNRSRPWTRDPGDRRWRQ